MLAKFTHTFFFSLLLTKAPNSSFYLTGFPSQSQLQTSPLPHPLMVGSQSPKSLSQALTSPQNSRAVWVHGLSIRMSHEASLSRVSSPSILHPCSPPPQGSSLPPPLTSPVAHIFLNVIISHLQSRVCCFSFAQSWISALANIR